MHIVHAHFGIETHKQVYHRAVGHRYARGDAVQFALDQEVKVTNQINNLVSIAEAEKDYASVQFLQWFVTEQVEEVDSMTTLLNTIKHSGGALLLVEDFVRRQMAAGNFEEGEA